MQDRRSKATYYRCRSVYGRMEVAQINQLDQLKLTPTMLALKKSKKLSVAIGSVKLLKFSNERFAMRFPTRVNILNTHP